MAIGGAATCAKIMLIIVNVVFILSGLLLLAIGIWLTVDQTVLRLVSFVVSEQSTLFRAAAGLLIAMGILVLIVAALGFAGAVTENAIVLGIYIGLLAVVFCGEITAGIVAIAYQDKITNQVTKSMSSSIRTAMSPSSPYYSLNNATGACSASSTGASWDYVQLYFNCCGVQSYAMSGYEDASIYLPSICPSLHLYANKPLTCCSHRISSLASNMNPNNQTAFVDQFDCRQIVSYGCADAMVSWIAKYSPVLIGIGIGVGMFEMIVAIFALCLCQHRDK